MRDAPPGAPAAEPVPLACPRCRAPVEPGQLSCLECGAGLRFRDRRLPGWRLTAAAVGILVLLAGTLLGLGAGSLLGDDQPVPAGNPGTEAAVPTAPESSSTAPTTTATVPEATTPPPGEGAASGQPVPEATSGSQEPGDSGTPEETTPPGGSGTTTSPTTTTAPAGGPGETLTWPSGESGYTAVLASVADRDAAEDAARRARQAGIDAGVLSSDDYDSLRPGYWVAFAGRLSSAEEAEEAAARHRGQGFPDAYPRQVRP